MHDEHPATIVPEPCGIRLNPDPESRKHVYRIGPCKPERRCRNCTPLGTNLIRAGWDTLAEEIGPPCWRASLAWNLTLAALLETAAVRAVAELERTRDELKRADLRETCDAWPQCSNCTAYADFGFHPSDRVGRACESCTLKGPTAFVTCRHTGKG